MKVQFDLDSKENAIIKVIGVGGGGSNAVNYMYEQGIKGVDFAICNTDNQALQASPVPTKFQLGPNLTEGRGAGSKPEVGRQAGIESIQEIEKYIQNNTKMLFIAAGMGGGTGTGAAPVIAEKAQEMGILTIAIVTIPFRFEGKKRERYANQGIEELKEFVDSIIIVSNNKLCEIHGNLPISEAFRHADNILSSAAKGISEIITVEGYVNTDFEDVNTVMRNSGMAIMGAASAEGQDRAIKAISTALNSPLLDDNDLKGAQDILFHVTSGTKEVTLDEIYQITEYIEEEVQDSANIIWGNSFDEKLGEKLTITVIATGFDKDEDIENEINTLQTQIVEKVQPKSASTTVKSNIHLEQVHTPTEVREIKKERTVVHLDDSAGFQTGYSNSKQADNLFKTAIDSSRGQKEPYIADVHGIQPSLPFDEVKDAQNYNSKPPSYKDLEKLESVPAFKRKNVQLEDVRSSREYKRSTMVIDVDGEGNIREENPYLYDNVD